MKTQLRIKRSVLFVFLSLLLFLSISSFVQAGDSLYQPNSGLPGWNAQDIQHPTSQELTSLVSHSYYSINIVWTLLAGFLVMFMQAGFALVETGMVRLKNAVHTMSMNLAVYGISMTGFFLCGFALMCGGANGTAIGGPGSLGGIPVLDKMATLHLGSLDWGIFGKTGFLLSGKAYDASTLVWFFFMMVFMDTAATIPTGALAERWKFKSFAVFSFFIGALIYPLYGAWVWGGGWLSQLGLGLHLGHGVVDYAGSSVVHLQGGVLALVLAKLLGPRLGKYSSEGKPRAIRAHNIPMVFLGTFILAFGWFGFNAGSSLAGSDERIGVIVVNTMLASASGTLAAMILTWWRANKPDPLMMCNGMLAGLVAVTAPCAFIAPWAAYLIGMIAGVLVVFGSEWIEKAGIDDPVGAVAVHGINGAWGLIALGLFADGTYGSGWNGVSGSVRGLFYGDASQLWAECAGVAVCIGWNCLAGGLLFKFTGWLTQGNRVKREAEILGLDHSEFGCPLAVTQSVVDPVMGVTVGASESSAVPLYSS